MKLYATMENTRKGKKSTGDDTRLLMRLNYGNKEVGQVALYAIKDWPSGEHLGYRVIWFGDNTPAGGQVLAEEEKKGDKQKGKHICEKTHCDNETEGGYAYCRGCIKRMEEM